MHIAEGFLPWRDCVGWTLAAFPAWAMGLRNLRSSLRNNPSARLELGAAGGFTFLVSALKLPSVTGSSSHPTGIALGAVRLGPWEMVLVGSVVLVFQALFLGHGGITTLGANAFAMGVVGSWCAWLVFRTANICRIPVVVGWFCAAVFSDLATYATTAFQLALAFPDPQGGFWGAWGKFLGLFAFTQAPLAVAEGLLTVWVVRMLSGRALAGKESVA